MSLDMTMARLRAADPAMDLPPTDPRDPAARQMYAAILAEESSAPRLRQTPRRRNRLAWMVAAAAVAIVPAAIAAVAIGTNVPGNTGTPVASGHQILLAAATTVENTPEGTGAYWYVKVVSTGSHDGDTHRQPPRTPPYFRCGE